LSIAELADPRLRGMIAMSSPSRSGTTHLMVETVLQRYGWEKGWETWLGLAGNLATVTARSFSVSAGVQNRRFAIGLSIDFLSRANASTNRELGAAGIETNEQTRELGFAYPAETAFLPASIAILKSGRSHDNAKRFVAFILSDEGQKLLADPHVGRHPVNLKYVSRGQDDLFALAEARNRPVVFNAQLSGQRYELVNIMFDELITERLARIQKFWRVYDALRAHAGDQTDLRRQLDEARKLAVKLPVELTEDQTLPLHQLLKRVPRGVPLPPEQAAFLERSRAAIETQFLQAERILEVVALGLTQLDRSTGGPSP
jgi:phosphoglycerate transport regulatory protein PgtC